MQTVTQSTDNSALENKVTFMFYGLNAGDDTIEHEYSHKDDAWKSRILFRTMGIQEHKCFTNVRI